VVGEDGRLPCRQVCLSGPSWAGMESHYAPNWVTRVIRMTPFVQGVLAIAVVYLALLFTAIATDAVV
jgi:hypothetical protein